MTLDKPTIKVGQAIPGATIYIKSEDGIDAIETKDYFKNCKVIMIAIPGAFTRTCSAKHLPGYIKNAEKIRAAGFDKIGCLAVNDAHVMLAWGLEQKAGGIVDMIADPLANFSDKLGISADMGPILGRRATRCAMIIENGILKRIFMEEPSAFEISSAEHVLVNL